MLALDGHMSRFWGSQPPEKPNPGFHAPFSVRVPRISVSFAMHHPAVSGRQDLQFRPSPPVWGFRVEVVFPVAFGPASDVGMQRL
jgi:hypothetical protein